MASTRYIVHDVAQAVAFYTQRLGFILEQQAGTAFARVSRDGHNLWLSGPQSSGARPIPDGRRPEPGGWNRLVLEVDDIEAVVKDLRAAGVPFRNDIITGPGGKQILVDDPFGNPVELFEAAK